MTGPMTRDELLAALPDLSAAALDDLIRGGIVRPMQSESGPLFRPVDHARLRLAMDLQDAYGLDRDGLALVLSLIDQVNGLRGDMRAMLRAAAAEPPETRARMRQVIRETRITIRRG